MSGLLRKRGVHVLVQRQGHFFGFHETQLCFGREPEHQYACRTQSPYTAVDQVVTYSRKSISRCLVLRASILNRAAGESNKPGRFFPVGMMNVSSEG